MNDCMTFPNSWKEFLHSYSFFDTDKVYTNGSELIQVFRVEQLLEHIEQMTEHRPKAPEPVKARWLFDRGSHYKCSHCGSVWDDTVFVMSYCPHCGAEMDERIPIMGDDGNLKAVLRDALTLAIHALGEEQPSKSCTYYDENNKKPYCNHDCNGCMWYREAAPWKD